MTLFQLGHNQHALISPYAAAAEKPYQAIGADRYPRLGKRLRLRWEVGQKLARTLMLLQQGLDFAGRIGTLGAETRQKGGRSAGASSSTSPSRFVTIVHSSRVRSMAIIDRVLADRWEALDVALDRLAKLSPRQTQIVELRYFGGLTIEETAALLDLSEKTVKRDWAAARAWLRRELGEPPAPTTPARG